MADIDGYESCDESQTRSPEKTQVQHYVIADDDDPTSPSEGRCNNAQEAMKSMAMEAVGVLKKKQVCSQEKLSQCMAVADEVSKEVRAELDRLQLERQRHTDALNEAAAERQDALGQVAQLQQELAAQAEQHEAAVEQLRVATRQKISQLKVAAGSLQAGAEGDRKALGDAMTEAERAKKEASAVAGCLGSREAVQSEGRTTL